MHESSKGLRLYDAHCHLQDERLAPHLERIAEDLSETRVQKVIVNGTREEDWPRVQDLSRTYTFVVPSFGLHPWYIKNRSCNWRYQFEAALSDKGAIGEIGLDRWIEDYDSNDQEKIFIEQLAVAASLQRPISIHCLKAWGRLLEILSNESLPDSGFLLHSYNGPGEMIDSFVKVGAYFSFSGYFAHEKKAKQQEVFRHVPLDRLLVETDAPDMALPEPLREFNLPGGELNHPANLRAVYNFAAALRGMELKEFASAVEKNFNRFFRAVL